MSELRPVFVVGPPGGGRERAIQALPDELEARTAEGVDQLLDQLPPPSQETLGITAAPGVIVAAADVEPRDLLRLLRALAERPDPWIPLVVEPGEEGAPTARLVSLGFAEPLADVVLRGADPDASLPVLELRSVLRLVARARHDINNPLTAGMAEAQLLLMDVEDPELRESVELIQDQFNRIKDLVAELQSLKRARPG